MLARLLLWIDIIILIFIKVNEGYVRTYADNYYGRIRGSNQATGVDGGIIFLIIFGCIIGGFFIVCILGTLIFGFFDNGFRYPQGLFRRPNLLPNLPVDPFIPSMNSRL